MKERILTLLLFLAPCFLPLTVAQGLSEQEIIQKMSVAAEAIRTVRCDFTQTRHSKMLKNPQVSKGKMSCQQPDKLRWEYTSPKASAIVLNGTDVTIDNGQGTNSKGQGFIREMARMIMNSVAGKYLTDGKAFQVSAKEMPTEYVATLIPLRKEMKRMYSTLVLHFDTKQATVTKVELLEKDGDRTIIELHGIHINE